MSARVLPPWPAVLAAVARPDDESFGLGAVLSGFAEPAAAVWVLCLTRGEAAGVILCSDPDGGLAEVPVDVLMREVREARWRPRTCCGCRSLGGLSRPRWPTLCTS